MSEQEIIVLKMEGKAMSECRMCGCEFDVSEARRSIGQMYGAGVYNDYYPNGDVCRDCAIEEISCDYATGAEIMELMGTSWEDD